MNVLLDVEELWFRISNNHRQYKMVPMKMEGYSLLIDLMNEFPLNTNIYFIFGQSSVIISVSMLFKLQALGNIEH